MPDRQHKPVGRRHLGGVAGELQNKYAVYGCKTITMCNDPKLNTEQTENAANYKWSIGVYPVWE